MRGYGCFTDDTQFLKMEKERMSCGFLGRRSEEVQIEAAWAVGESREVVGGDCSHGTGGDQGGEGKKRSVRPDFDHMTTPTGPD